MTTIEEVLNAMFNRFPAGKKDEQIQRVKIALDAYIRQVVQEELAEVPCRKCGGSGSVPFEEGGECTTNVGKGCDVCGGSGKGIAR